MNPNPHDGQIHFRVVKRADGRLFRVEALINGEVVGVVPSTGISSQKRPTDLGRVQIEVYDYRVETVTEDDE
jgi:hypothetical protein